MRHFLSSEQSLVKSKQHFVYFKNIVIAVHYKIFDYYIEFVAVGKRKARFHKKLLGFVKIKLKRNRKSNCRIFARLIMYIRKLLPISAE